MAKKSIAKVRRGNEKQRLGTELRRLAKALPCEEERSTEALWKSVAKQRKVIKIKYFKKEN